MIRILHVVTYMGRGGLETMIMNYYRHIDKNKIQFDFLVHRDFEADYDQEIKQLGGHIYHLPRLNPFSRNYRKEFKQFLKEHSYQIIHVHQDCLSSIALKVAYQNDIPTRIAHAHSTSQDKNIKYLIKRFYMRSIPKYATHLFACGREAGDWMFQGKSFEIVNNAIDSQNFKYDELLRSNVRKALSIKDNEVVIGHVGRFNYPKNHEFIIDIFNDLTQKDKRFKLLLVGTGDLEDKIKEKVKDLNLQDKVLFLGSRSDVNELMQAMDIFLFPSHYEGLGIVAIEAQASGLPIIKSNNVPDQCKITSNVWSLSLDDNINIWVNKILEVSESFERKDTSKYIKEAGYDINSNVKWLEDFYLSEVKKRG